MTAKYFSGSPTLVEAAAVLKSMADPNRLRILDLLARRESCHAELKEKLGLPPVYSRTTWVFCERPAWCRPGRIPSMPAGPTTGWTWQP